MRTLCRHLLSHRGTTSLEFILTALPWLAALAMLFNVVLFATNIVLAQGALNALTMRVASQSCLAGSDRTDIEQRQLLNTGPLRIDARSAPARPDFSFDRSAVARRDGSPQPLTAKNLASCAATGNGSESADGVAGTHYIWLRLSYTQHLFFGPSFEVTRTQLAVSNSYRGGS